MVTAFSLDKYVLFLETLSKQYFKFVLYSLFERKQLITKIFVRRYNVLRRYFSFLRRCCTLHVVYDIMFAPSPKNGFKMSIFIENIIILLINCILTLKNITSVGDMGCDIKMPWHDFHIVSYRKYQTSCSEKCY